jgi:tRNA modification GTPase
MEQETGVRAETPSDHPPHQVRRAVANRAFVTVLTPEGRGAVGVVRVWGRGAVKVADSVFRPATGGRLATTPPARLRLGRVGLGLGDEVVAVVLEGDPPSVEIQCHGGPAPLALVVDALIGAGAEISDPARWVQDEIGSPLKAAALLDLARVPTVRTAEILLDQAQGALDRELTRLIAGIAENPESALADLELLIERAQLGLRLVTGWRVVITGRTNVGKSRLLNALAGYQRAIVDPTPGTTRDVVTVRTAFEGWPVELADTAGIRGTDDVVERAGIGRGERQKEAADLVLKVLDCSQPLQSTDRELIEAPGQAILVASKGDLPAAWQPEEMNLDPGSILTVSAERGVGLDRLIAAVVLRLVPQPPDPGAGVPFRVAQVECLRQVRESLRCGEPNQAVRWIEDCVKGLATMDRDPDPGQS